MVRMLRKSLLGILFGVLVFSCKERNAGENNNSYNPVTSSNKQTLMFLGHWLDEGAKEQLLHESITQFEFLNQETRVHLDFFETMSTRDDLKIKNIILFNKEQILADVPEWDILKVNNAFYSLNGVISDKNWMKNNLVDFCDYPEFVANTRPELLTDSFKAQYGGIIPGPLVDGFNWPLWCNTDVAKKVGINIKQFGMTFDDFVSYIEAVDRYNNNNGDSIYGLLEAGDFPTAHTLGEMLYYGELKDIQRISNFDYNPEKVKEWEKVLRKLERLGRHKPIPKNWKSYHFLDVMNWPLDNKCLFFINGSWMYNIWLKQDSQKVQKMMPATLPEINPSPVCIGGYNIPWVVPKRSKNKDAAVKFLLSLNTPEFAEKWLRYTKSPTGVKGKLTTLSFGSDKFEDFQVYIDTKYGKRKINLSWGSAFCFGNKYGDVNNYSDEVIAGEISADEAIKNIRKSLKRGN